MSNWKDFFTGKKVTLMGLGLLGRGLGDAIFLAENGAELIITDLRDEQTLASSLEKLKKYKNIEYVLGKHRLKDFRERNFIVKAAGVPLDSPYIAEAQKNGVPMEMDASLFAKLMPKGVVLVGVTGTRGKSTTTALIYEILREGIENRELGIGSKKRNIYKGGNLVPEATLPLLEKVKAGDIVVLELDSWQLQGFHDAKISPHVAVFTTFLDDHLVYYKGDTGRYFEDKVAIFKYQNNETNEKNKNILIAGERVAKLIGKSEIPVTGDVVVATKEDVPKDWNIAIPGEHNLENIACALHVAGHFKIPIDAVRKAVEDFKGVPGRLEFIREVGGVKIYNDTNATTPDATLAGLRALGESRIGNREYGKEKKIILICGGTDKGLDMSELVAEIPKYCKAVVFLKESGIEKLFVTYNVKRIASDKESRTLHATRYTRHKTPAYEMETLEGCIKQAMELAERNDTLLFSPAFASFGKWFKNEYDRGAQFVELIQKL